MSRAVRLGPPKDGMGRLWLILKAAVSCYLANDALSRGAAIAFCHVKAIGAARAIAGPGKP